MTGISEIHIEVDRREETGTSAARRLRRKNLVPAVVYGGENPPYPITADEKVVRDLIRKHGENTIFLLKLSDSDTERQAMIKNLVTHPITGELTHIDFIRVTKGHVLHVNVDVDLVGDSIGVRHGGRMDFVTRELQVAVLPKDMFSKIEVDISELEIGDHIEVGNLTEKLPGTAKFLEDDHRVVVVIEAPRLEEEEDEEGEDLVIAESAEPELIRKGKDEEDE